VGSDTEIVLVASGGAEVARWPLPATSPPDLSVVDALARLQLRARRSGCTIRLVDPSPRLSRDNAYPLAAERILSFFADPSRSPDVAVVHTPRHFFPTEGGHVGEHGSLDVIQSRAPLVLAGAGIRPLGLLDHHARLVDVGPTLAFLAGVPEAGLHDAHGDALDGRVLHAYLEEGVAPRAVVGVLWDGAHCGELLAMAQAGELPGVASTIVDLTAYESAGAWSVVREGALAAAAVAARL